MVIEAANVVNAGFLFMSLNGPMVRKWHESLKCERKKRNSESESIENLPHVVTQAGLYLCI